jgi:hypothetical protein
LIRLGPDFKVNTNKETTKKIYNFPVDKHTLEEWVTFFKNKFTLILEKDKYYPNSFKTIIILTDEKLDN